MSGGSARSAGLMLRRPTLDDEAEFILAHRATTPETPSFLHYYEEGMSFGRYLQVLEERERGVNLPPRHVPSTFLFAFRADRIVGRVSIRHALNESLLRVGGHIGYVVVPRFRRQGHATAILRMAVEFARDTLGLDRVLLTCDADNVGSIKTIERNGGIQEDIVSGPDREGRQRRYWIETGPAKL